MRFQSHVERVLARGTEHPDQVVLREVGRSVTAAQLRRLVTGVADRLTLTGVEPGTLVALAATNSIEAVVARYAAGLLGAATVCCPHANSAELLDAFLADVRVDMILSFAGTSDAASAVADRGIVPAHLMIDRLDLRETDPQEPEPSAEAEPRMTSPAGDDLAVLIASGGTTGTSKASCRSFGEWLNVVAGPPNPRRRQLICTPLAYIAQLHLDLTLLGDGTVILLERFDPAEVLRAIETHAVTHLGLVEPLLVELLHHPDWACRDLSTLTSVTHIGADAAPSLRRRLLERAGPILLHPYGASETGIVSLLGPAEYDLDHPDQLATAGRLLAGVDVRILRPDRSAADPGETGRILVRSTQLAHGYHGHGTPAAFADGWFRTGDLGCVDAAGYLHVRGRAADERRLSRRSVLPVDIQQALCAHPAVRYAVAVPLPPTDGGFGAVLQADPDMHPPTPNDVNGFVRTHFGDHVVPDQTLIVDRIPRTEQGKPARADILQILQQHRDAASPAHEIPS